MLETAQFGAISQVGGSRAPSWYLPIRVCVVMTEGCSYGLERDTYLYKVVEIDPTYWHKKECL